ncbi:quinone-dependent dihydroorotate dehydrogenase [Litorihabitans aurantiacus]|uniref:Dihydroorotate dehydrogenase (quinone) n=1 Tax=Litorihabitans aurantiacus TaxID=1930061 RepID=A0AA37XE58_9MICO|nr:quinone-dependent dihydroorotate dehydrogenase [Litorihabitans aurantiacus]GMA31498.1 dihydroorotate dehydrogenase (quinone) [Litorihabitans aurantiacus]
MPSQHSLYDLLYRTVLVRTDAERAHHAAALAIEAAGRFAPTRALLGATLGRTAAASEAPGAAAPLTVFGRHLTGPLGTAAGFDKDARMVLGLVALGFSHVEIGTVTAQAQPGNDRPRLFRVVAERALRNRMGFNNAGCDAVALRLARLRRTRAGAAAVVGVNIGKTKVTPADDAAADYARSARTLAPYADYLVVNVSSPNTPGLRDLQATSALRPILQGVQEAADAASHRRVPVLVKIAPDLSDDGVRDVVALVTELDLAGVVATNTTIRHDHGDGGVSGAPLRMRAREVVALVRAELGREKVVIGVGGVEDAADVAAMRAAGADLVQAYSAFVYRGPAWPGRVNRAARAGFSRAAARA